MTTLQNAKDAWNQAQSKFRKNTPVRTVYLGDGKGFATSNIVVQENPSLFYARENLSDKEFLVIPNYNAQINPRFNLPVVVGYDQTNPNIEQILGVDLSGFPYQSATSVLTGQAPHHAQHEFGGGDEVFVDAELLKVGLFTPDNPPTMAGYVQPFYYTHRERGLSAFSGSRVDQITSFVPSSSGVTRLVGLSFNPDSGSLVYRTGYDFLTTSTSATVEELLAGGGSAVVAGRSASLPVVPGGEIPIATFSLTSTTTSLNWSATSSAYYHSRLFLGKVDTDIYSRLDSIEKKNQLMTLPTTGANLFSAQVNKNIHDADYFRLGRINDFQSSGSSPSWGTKLYFSGALGTQSWNSENSDPLWMARYNEDNDVSHLRVSIGDNPTSASDAFQIGTTQSDVFTPRIDLTSDSKLRFHDSNFYVGFSPPALSGNQIWVLPSADGSNGQIIQTDGNGILSWATSTVALDTVYARLDLDNQPFIAAADTTTAFQVQANDTTAVFNVDTTNERVGIGTDSPDVSLEIAGGGAQVVHINAGGNAQIEIDKGGANNSANFRFQTADVTDWNIGTTDSDIAGDGTEFYIGTLLGGNNAEFTIKKSGVVGINTIAPGARLHIVGGADEIQQIIQANATQTSNIVEIQNSGGTRLTSFNSAGYLGIGTDADSQTLIKTLKTFTSGSGTHSHIDVDARFAYSTSSAQQALKFEARSNTGTIGRLSGISFVTRLQSASGTLNEAVGVAAKVQNGLAGGTITESKGILIQTPINSGSIITNYGIYVDNQNTATTDYAIYTNSGLNRLGDQFSIIGSQDIVQQIIQANATQTSNIVEIQNSGGTPLTVFNGLGYLGFNETAPSAFIEIDDAGTVTFIRSKGDLTDNGAYLINATNNVVHGDSVTFIRLVPTWKPSANNKVFTNISGNIEVSSSSNTGLSIVGNKQVPRMDGTFSGTVASFKGFTAGSSLDDGTTGDITDYYAYYVSDSGATFIANKYGLYVESQTEGTALNYAIYTNDGVIRFGDAVHLKEITTPSAIADHGAIYPKADNILYWQDGAGTEKAIVDDDDTMDSFIVLSTYDAEPARGSESNLHGGLLSLATGQPLDSVPTDLVVTKGIGKILIVVNAGSDLAGDITVSGTVVDRDTGSSGADTDTITVDAVTTDTSDTDGNGNTRHAFAGAYITSKWFHGTVTLSTADLTLTDVDVYHVSFEQFNDQSNLTLTTLDVNLLTTNVNAEFDAYLYTLEVTGDKCDIERTASVNVGTDGFTALANKYERLRRGALGKALDGSTDGVWVDVHYANSPAYIEDMNLKVWATKTQSITIN